MHYCPMKPLYEVTSQDWQKRVLKKNSVWWKNTHTNWDLNEKQNYIYQRNLKSDYEIEIYIYISFIRKKMYVSFRFEHKVAFAFAAKPIYFTHFSFQFHRILSKSWFNSTWFFNDMKIIIHASSQLLFILSEYFLQICA